MPWFYHRQSAVFHLLHWYHTSTHRVKETRFGWTIVEKTPKERAMYQLAQGVRNTVEDAGTAGQH